MGRRRLLTMMGRGALGVLVLGAGAVACGPGAGDGDAGTGDAGDTGGPTGPAADGLTHHRVDLDFVSAYVLVRGGRIAVVDTGTEGSAPAIHDVIREVGLDWDAVDHVIVTHHHPDHQGGLPAVLEAARSATAHAGEADIGEISSPRPLQSVGDDDEVFGLQIVATPGHTAGHISVLDRGAGLLVAGDALVGSDGGVGGPDPEFTADMATARASVRKLAGLEFDTALFGHGEPVTGNADEQVAELVETR